MKNLPIQTIIAIDVYVCKATQMYLHTNIGRKEYLFRTMLVMHSCANQIAISSYNTTNINR
jgi:hypothetical protein